MPRRFTPRRRGSSERVIHGRQWLVFDFGRTPANVGTETNPYVLGQTDFEALQVPEGRHLTVLRTRGTLLATLATENRTVYGAFYAALMNLASDDTVTNAELPLPWQLENTFVVHPIALSNLAAGGSAADGPGSFQRMMVDSKSMRRGSENGRVVFWFDGGTNSSTANIYFTGRLYVLLGLRD